MFLFSSLTIREHSSTFLRHRPPETPSSSAMPTRFRLFDPPGDFACVAIATRDFGTTRELQGAQLITDQTCSDAGQKRLFSKWQRTCNEVKLGLEHRK
jgi:hypothetical protein